MQGWQGYSWIWKIGGFWLSQQIHEYSCHPGTWDYTKLIQHTRVVGGSFGPYQAKIGWKMAPETCTIFLWFFSQCACKGLFRFEALYVSALFALVEVRSCFSMLWPPTRHNKAASSTTLRPPSNYCVLKKDATARRREESTILNGTGTSLESSHEATSLELID